MYVLKYLLLITDINLVISSCYPINYIGYDILMDIIKNDKFGFPRRYASGMDHGMRMLTIIHYLTHLIAPLTIIVFPLVNYLQIHHWSEMSILDRGLLIFWSVVLLISTRQAISVSILLIQQSFFLNCYFKNNFHFVSLKICRSLDRIDKCRNRPKCNMVNFYSQK